MSSTRSSSSSDDNRNVDSLQRAQSQYERKLAIQRELARMDHYAKGVEDFLTDCNPSSLFAPIDNISHSSRSSCSSHNSNGSIPPGVHSPPEGAVETARKFLWDEDDDDVSLPPSRDFEGRVHNNSGGEVSIEEQSPPTPTISNSFKGPGLLRSVMNRLSRYDPLQQYNTDRCTTPEFGINDANSTISSNEETFQNCDGVVTIDLGDGPADTGNRNIPTSRKSESWCKKCVATLAYGCCSLLQKLKMCFCNLSPRRKLLVLLVFLVAIALVVVGSIALLQHLDEQNQQGSDDGAISKNGTLAPQGHQVSTHSPTLAPVVVTEEPTIVDIDVPPKTQTPSVKTPTQSPTVTETTVTTPIPTPSPTSVATTSPPTQAPTTVDVTEAPVDTSSPTLLPTFDSTLVETPEGGTAPFDTDRYDAIKNVIVTSNVTSVKQLDTLGTAQNKAILWLTDYDLAKVGPKHESSVLQRYALATFFFSTTSFHTGGTPHDTVQQAMNAVLTNPQPTSWNSGTNWMTQHGICRWEGVTCPPHDHNEGQHSAKKEKRQQEQPNAHANAVIHFNLTSNGMSGVLPSEISALRELQSLDLSNNSIYGRIPASIGRLAKLVNISLSGNELTGSIPTEMGRCTSLNRLSLENNKLMGSVPDKFSDLRDLRVLRLQNNSLTGTLPNVTSLHRLQILDVASNDIVGTIPVKYGMLSSLVVLGIGHNKLQGNIPGELSFLSSLEYLGMSNNGLYGTIPDMFQDMVHLKEVTMSKNKFSGSLPRSLGGLSSIGLLAFDSNEFSGTLPFSYAGLPQLKTLHVFDNNLTGFIPSVMDGWQVSLMDFRAHRNSLRGTIPPAFGSTSKLEILHLEDNSLSGTISSLIGQLNKLRSFRFFNNRIVGVVPDEVCNLIDNHELEFLAADCAANGGTVHCDCCQECHPL